jgi:hypothetical protein
MERRLLPIACSLEGDEARHRWLVWRALLAGRLSDERSERELRVRFRDHDDVSTELHRLVAAERECCGFVDWDLARLQGELVLTVKGEESAVASIDAAFSLGG